MLRVFFVLFFCLASSMATAQFNTFRNGSILVLDQASLLTQSNLGKAILALEKTEQDALLETGREIAEQLEAEEAELTELRDSMENAEFRLLADAFNDKVEATRARQSAIDDAQLVKVEARRRAFFQFIVPQLGELIQKYNAAAIIDRRSVLLFDKNLDITLETITLLNALYEENPEMIDLGSDTGN